MSREKMMKSVLCPSESQATLTFTPVNKIPEKKKKTLLMRLL